MKRQKLYLLLIMILSFSFLSGCSKDDSNDNNENRTIVPSLTGAITKEGIDFSNPKLKCTKITITQGTPTRATQADSRYSSIQLDFNDNLQVVIRSVCQADYSKDTKATQIYFLFKNCFKNGIYDGDFKFNLLKDGKIVHSETLNPPANADWWKMASDDSYFTLDLDFKGKEMSYKGQIKYTFDK